MKQLETLEELTERYKLKPATVRRLIRQGRIPVVRISAKVWRFDPEAVNAAMGLGLGVSGDPGERNT